MLKFSNNVKSLFLIFSDVFTATTIIVVLSIAVSVSSTTVLKAPYVSNVTINIKN